ncbi:MAG: hypothetical protein AB7P78_09835 [Candidatus Binatia bacterium]
MRIPKRAPARPRRIDVAGG